MNVPAYLDMTVDRWVDWLDLISFIDNDYTGASFKLQIRPIRDTTGTPLLELISGSALTLAYAGTATVSAHVAAGRLTGTGPDNIYTLTNPATGNLYQPTDNVLLSSLSIGVDQIYVASLPFAESFGGKRGDDTILYYDLVVTVGGVTTSVILRGEFIVRAGVTIP
jgi:hypothetical protein